MSLRARARGRHRLDPAAWLACCLAACASAPTIPDAGADTGESAGPSVLIGEVHLHQFPGGSHAAANFVAGGVPIDSVHRGTLIELSPPAVARSGLCDLVIEPRCSVPCAEGSWCTADETCSPLPSVSYIDGGAIEVRGSTIVPLVRLWFDPSGSDYVSDPPPGANHLFAGGEFLTVTGGQAGDRYSGSVEAPTPVVLVAPDPQQAFVLPTSGPLVMRWQPAEGDAMVAILTAGDQNGNVAFIRCVAPDVGTLEVPSELLARLPPPPRSLRLELSRDHERVIVTENPAHGVLVHASFTAWLDGA